MKICSYCGASNTDWAHNCLKCHQPFQNGYKQNEFQYDYPSTIDGTNSRPDGSGDLQGMGGSYGFQEVDASEFYTLIPDITDQDTVGGNYSQTEAGQIPQNHYAIQNGMPNNGMPNNGMSNNGMPNNGMSNNSMPNNGMPNNGMPNNGMLNNGMLNNSTPNNGMVNNGMQDGSQNAGKNCPFCGTKNESIAAFCEYCGKPLDGSRAGHNAQSFGGDQGYGHMNSYQGGHQGVPAPALLDKFVSKMKISSTIWLILGIYQCVIGLPLIMFFGYGLTTIGLGVWNIIQSQKKKKLAEQYYQNPTGIVAAMESSQTLAIVFLILNLFFGGLFGVAGAIYDLTIISFVTGNRHAFESMGRQNYAAGGYNNY